jgi:hypothetical protein
MQSYQYSIAKIAEKLIALLGTKRSTLAKVVFLEEHPSDGLGSFRLYP